MLGAETILFPEGEIGARAEEYFIRVCGFDLSKDKHREMLREAMEVRASGMTGLNVAARLAAFGPEVYQNGKIIIDGAEIAGEIFHAIDEESVRRVYLSVLTAGECFCGNEESMSTRLYADLWGTAYVDAGRDLLESMIREDAGVAFPALAKGETFLSEALSPGFYGIPPEENAKIVRALRGSILRIKAMVTGVMLPVKTCCSIYLVADDPFLQIAADCMQCAGNPGGCALCRVRNVH